MDAVKVVYDENENLKLLIQETNDRDPAGTSGDSTPGVLLFEKSTTESTTPNQSSTKAKN
jgi:hypothetical protein